MAPVNNFLDIFVDVIISVDKLTEWQITGGKIFTKWLCGWSTSVKKSIFTMFELEKKPLAS